VIDCCAVNLRILTAPVTWAVAKINRRAPNNVSRFADDEPRSAIAVEERQTVRSGVFTIPRSQRLVVSPPA
jgi:hypothetical protein